MKIDTANLVRSHQLLEILFPHADCRPSLRWLQRVTHDRIIPHYKIGHLVFYNPDQVREKLERKNLIRAI